MGNGSKELLVQNMRSALYTIFNPQCSNTHADTSTTKAFLGRREIELESVNVRPELEGDWQAEWLSISEHFRLHAAIVHYIEKYQMRYPDLKIVFAIESEEQLSLLRWKELPLFQIVQEGIRNIIQHAAASKVLIRSHRKADWLILEIQDNGIGFTVPKSWSEMARQGHLGLFCAAKQADRIGGFMKVESVPGWGTTVSIFMPLRDIY
jgi:signal transduction histidine kinase